MKIIVECYSGYRAEESPRRLVLGERCVEVRRIVDRWIGEDHRYFKVEGDDGCLYLIRYGDAADAWELVSFEAAPFDLPPEE